MLAGAFSRHFSRQNAALGANGGQKRCHRDAKAAGTGAAGPGYDLKPPKTTAIARVVMARCETCGNDYDKAFQVSMNGTTHTFDSFECAIHALAPTCENCGIRAAGGKTDDQAHRPRRIVLRSRQPRYGWQRGSACGQMQKL